MSARLVPYTADGLTRLDIYRANLSGALVDSSIALNDSRRVLSDAYLLTASAASGATATITRTTLAPADTSGGRYLPPGSGIADGPFYSTVFTGVTFPSTRSDIIPGVDIPFGSGAPANGHQTVVRGGIWLGEQAAGNAAGEQLQWTGALGLPGQVVVSPGEPNVLLKLLIKNVSADALTGCKAVNRPKVKPFIVTAPAIFTAIYAVDDSPHERAVGGTIKPSRFTCTSAGGGLASLKLNTGSGAAFFNVRNINTGVTSDSQNLEADDATPYQITDATYTENAEFFVSSAITTSSIENVLVWDPKFVQYANDASGAPGTWDSDFVWLTQSGQGQGIMQPAGTCILWVKVAIDGLAALGQSPLPLDIDCEYNLVGAGDFLGAP